ncbi:uncharacterized protein LOC121379975 [Gigantopelta aegis]|uniref:uncharacterized protein LOC121379975 n=1 Tax=Gigantopelta aegis TaxID=1735272 RepID=UPI001B889A99|nr:uncharacterized protein LOC121379975 [Gigantopelta aegis]
MNDQNCFELLDLLEKYDFSFEEYSCDFSEGRTTDTDPVDITADINSVTPETNRTMEIGQPSDVNHSLANRNSTVTDLGQTGFGYQNHPVPLLPHTSQPRQTQVSDWGGILPNLECFPENIFGNLNTQSLRTIPQEDVFEKPVGQSDGGNGYGSVASGQNQEVVMSSGLGLADPADEPRRDMVLNDTLGSLKSQPKTLEDIIMESVDEIGTCLTPRNESENQDGGQINGTCADILACMSSGQEGHSVAAAAEDVLPDVSVKQLLLNQIKVKYGDTPLSTFDTIPRSAKKLTPEERAKDEKRKESNRRSAARHRDRQKTDMANLKAKYEDLERRQQNIMKYIKVLNGQNHYLRRILIGYICKHRGSTRQEKQYGTGCC